MFFQKRSTSIPQASLKDLQTVEHRLKGSIKDLKHEIRLLKNEWNDTYQKLAKLYDRTRKAQKAMLQVEPDAAEEPQAAPNGSSGDLEVDFYRSRV